jgi:RsiW-degrading membrane proteinase PrsW (M82 family)
MAPEEAGPPMFALGVAILGALIPTALYVHFVWWLDRYEKEPLWLLALAFLWGAVPAAILSVIFEILLEVPLSALGAGSLASNLVSVSLGAPVIEESFKGIALIALVVLFRREFDDVLDGIIYGAMIGLGFAFTENAFAYFLPIIRSEGIAAGLTNIFLRSVIFGGNHAFWTGITGAAVGYARLMRRWERRLLIPVLGWVLAVVMHSIHNASATLAEETSSLTLLISIAIDWGGILLLAIIAALALRKEAQWIERGLVEEVGQGLITSAEFTLLSSAGRRLLTHWQARGRGGRQAAHAVRSYFQCATELAFKKRRLPTPGDEHRNLAEIQELRLDLASKRKQAWPWLWSEPS